MNFLLVSAIIPAVALLAWLFGLIRSPSGSAKFRHALAVSLIVYGIASVPIVFAAIFLGLEVGFVTWGGPDNFWIATFILSGLLSIAASAVMAVANIVALRFHPSDSLHQGD